MKKILFLFIAATLFCSTGLQAQVRVNINIGAQPQWGPPGHNYVRYYYLPDIESYYFVPRRQFIYRDNGRWIYSRYLPSRYRNYNLYKGHKVVLNRPDAYRHFERDRLRYAGYRKVYTQRSVRSYSHPRPHAYRTASYRHAPARSPHHFDGRHKNHGHKKGHGDGHRHHRR